MANIAITFFLKDVQHDKMPPFYEGLLKELQKKHSVILLNTFSSINTSFGTEVNFISEDNEKKIANFKPDLIIAFNNIISEKVYQTTNCPVLIVEADTYAYFKNKNLITKYLERNYIGIARRGRFEVWRELLPEMDKKERFFEFRNATSLYAKGIEQDVNISTIGTISGLQTKNAIIKFLEANWQNKEKMIQFHSIFQKAQFNLASISQEEYSFLGADYNHLFQFISYLNRAYLLDNVSDLGLAIWGKFYNTKEIFRALPSLGLTFKPEPVMTIEENANIYNRSKISLNIHFAHNVMKKSLSVYSWRVLDIMATNACLASTFCPAMEEDFEKWVKIPMFHNRHEAYDLCKKLLAEEDLRKEISFKSRLAVEEGGFTFETRVLELEEKFNLKETPKEQRIVEFLNQDSISLMQKIEFKTKKVFHKINRAIKKFK